MIKLFCVPYAGGSAAVYSTWQKYLSPSIQVYPVELSGRGRRFREKLNNNIQQVVDDIYENIKDEIESTNYALFGHSMGNLIVFELAHKLKEMKHKAPVHIFFSGRSAPDIEREYEGIYKMPDDEFAEEILSLGGTPEEVFKNKTLANIFIPILKADYETIETYEYKEKSNKLGVDITVLYGKQDALNKSSMEEWRNHTSQNCKIYSFDSGHFFINDKKEEVLNIINDTLGCS